MKIINKRQSHCWRVSLSIKYGRGSNTDRGQGELQKQQQWSTQRPSSDVGLQRHASISHIFCPLNLSARRKWPAATTINNTQNKADMFKSFSCSQHATGRDWRRRERERRWGRRILSRISDREENKIFVNSWDLYFKKRKTKLSAESQWRRYNRG